MTGSARSVDEVLAAARRRLERLAAPAAFAAQQAGAVIVDIRPHAQRLLEGEVPGALVIERNVLEWRFDPTSPARVPEARPDAQVVVLCSEGYTSSLAAAALQDVGVSRATDIVGGLHAWRAAGLPIAPGGTPTGARTPRPLEHVVTSRGREPSDPYECDPHRLSHQPRQ